MLSILSSLRSKKSHARFARSWSSDLKMLVSSFNNFLWTRIIENGDTVMEINDTFFTQVFNAVSGKKSCYSKYFDEFAIKFNIGYYLPWLSIHHKLFVISKMK